MKVLFGLYAVSALLSTVAATSVALQSDLAMNLQERPVMKVVRLLQDTKAELEKELEDDKAVYELMTCWCTSGTKDKEAAIEAAKAKISELESSMGAGAAKISELKAKRKETLDEVNADHKALMDATGMRMKENKEFQASETDYLEAIDAAKNAIIVLGKHNPSLAQVRAAAHHLLDSRVSQMVGHSKSMSKANVDELRSFLHNAESASSFLAIPGMQSYAPQSGQIFGILNQMKEDFEVNLSEAQKSEAKAKAEYESLKAAKEDEIDTGRKLLVDIDAQIAETQEKFAQEAKQLEDTQEQLAMDEEFLKSLKEKCATMDADYDKRTKDRLTEIEAVTDTIKILNSDESFEAFDKMVAPVFLQTDATESQKERRQRAVSALQRAAGLSGSPQIALLAASAQLDAFTKVKALIDKMVAELTKQQQDEVDHRDWCIDELNSNKRATTAAYDKKDSLEAQMADLKKTIEKLSKDIDASEKAVAETMNQMKRASETREADNADFQTTVSDHRVMSMILTKALDRMKQVYALLQQRGMQPGAPHTQTSGTHTDPGNGPAKFKKYDQNAGGGRVVAMLEEVLADTKKTEDQAMASEADSQSAYENIMKDSNKFILKTSQAISDMTGARATAKEELSMAKTDFSQTMTELEGLDQTNADLHKSCDYVLKNFDARQAARAAEMDALREAKNILSGAK
jgi:DNA repair exonuclease SbcCD ATPase subunit